MTQLFRVAGSLGPSMLSCLSPPKSGHGTVSTALKKLVRAMVRDDHLLFETASGTVGSNLANSTLGIEP